jgi:hypothetical protein
MARFGRVGGVKIADIASTLGHTVDSSRRLGEAVRSEVTVEYYISVRLVEPVSHTCVTPSNLLLSKVTRVPATLLTSKT